MNIEYTLLINKHLGSGAFGSVQSTNLQRHKTLTMGTEPLDDSMTYALKTLSPKLKKINPQTKQEEEQILSNSTYHCNLIRELCTIPKHSEDKMMQIFSPFVACIWFSSAFDTNGVPQQDGQQKAYILQRKFSMDCGYLFRKATLNSADKSNIYRCLLKHLRFLHEKGIAHRDLKPGNLLFHLYNYLFAVTDFGQSSLLEGISTQKINVGTRDIRAPEYLLDNESFAHGLEGDVWSFGMVVLCAELKKANQPLTLVTDISDEDNVSLRKIIRERFQGLFSPYDLSFGCDTVPKTLNARKLLARMLYASKTTAEMEEHQKQIPFACHLENLYLLHSALRMDPVKRCTANTLHKKLRLPILGKTLLTSRLHRQIPSIPEVPVQEKVQIPTQTLLDGTMYAQFPIPDYKVSVKSESKRKFMIQQLLLVLRCLNGNNKLPCNQSEFLMQSIDIFDRIFSQKAVKRMKELFYASTKNIGIPGIHTTSNIEITSTVPLFSVFQAKDLDREDFDDYDCLILSIYIADHLLHYGSFTTIETLIKKVYTSNWKGFNKTFLAYKTGSVEEQEYFIEVYWCFLKLKEKFLAHFFQESLASLGFSVEEHSLLCRLRRQQVASSVFMVTKVFKLLETKPSYQISLRDIDEIEMEFQSEKMAKQEELQWGFDGHSNAEYKKPFIVEL